ncbi:ABC transporter permease [Mesorhizobium sp. BR1-1-16]|uniref:ABC transporter permease n=1 Tax=Mesorhizobium sp. BR1-1-16 TaxID=2876653 RepID=UPI001CCA12A3|nr:ABC transporter permease [Mesorhizobium sp. BR1-1-16]MBZ9936894.1 ABC transporter permease [Mesorhizobium sp. BR1-1-16]
MRQMLGRLVHDKAALVAALYLLAVVVVALVAPLIVDASLMRSNLRLRHLPPLHFDHGWWYVLGGDALGRSMLARLVVAARTTLAISFATVSLSLVIGAAIGLVAGLSNAWWSTAIMRAIDVLMSIPSLLLAMVVLFVIGASPPVVVMILTVTRIPIFARTARGQALEIRERPFVSASRVMGASSLHLLVRHMAPLALPTLFSVAALEFAQVMLAESTLTFLGIGVQPPDVTWGLMVSDGQRYLATAWWSALWPGLVIASIALAATILGNWFQVANDPVLRARSARKSRVPAAESKVASNA